MKQELLKEIDDIKKELWSDDFTITGIRHRLIDLEEIIKSEKTFPREMMVSPNGKNWEKANIVAIVENHAVVLSIKDNDVEYFYICKNYKEIEEVEEVEISYLKLTEKVKALTAQVNELIKRIDGKNS